MRLHYCEIDLQSLRLTHVETQLAETGEIDFLKEAPVGRNRHR
jgi:hypothetical protein